MDLTSILSNAPVRPSGQQLSQSLTWLAEMDDACKLSLACNQNCFWHEQHHVWYYVGFYPDLYISLETSENNVHNTNRTFHSDLLKICIFATWWILKTYIFVTSTQVVSTIFPEQRSAKYIWNLKITFGRWWNTMLHQGLTSQDQPSTSGRWRTPSSTATARKSFTGEDSGQWLINWWFWFKCQSRQNYP